MENTATLEAPESSPPAPAAPRRDFRRWLWVLDMVLFLIITAAAFPIRMQSASGDLWGDEGDYAVASTKSIQSLRWDRSDDPKHPLALIELRHYHPPLLSYALKTAHHFGADEQTLRFPFILAGCITIGLVYLCGVSLYAGRREIALGAALIALNMPLHVRSSAHAIPWPFIGMLFMALTWTLLKYAETRRSFWLSATVVVLGILFTHSEMFYPALLMTALASPFVFWPEIKERTRRRSIAKGLGSGLIIALILIFLLWPAGILGGSLRMLSHYVGVSHELIPVMIAGVYYPIAPKTAYAYWLWNDYKPFAYLYIAGAGGLILLLLFRKGSRPIGIVTAAAILLLAVAHRAHIIGPEYLAHVTPFLALIAGLSFMALASLWRPLGILAVIFCCWHTIPWKPSSSLRERDAGEQTPRWSSAAVYLKKNWVPGDSITIGPQTVGVARWYIRNVALINADDAHILPLQVIKPGRNMMAKLTNSKIRYVMISSAFVDHPDIDPALSKTLKTWQSVYKSKERANRKPRMRIYEAPLVIPIPTLAFPNPIEKLLPAIKPIY